jgi:hypothetical protein
MLYPPIGSNRNIDRGYYMNLKDCIKQHATLKDVIRKGENISF